MARKNAGCLAVLMALGVAGCAGGQAKADPLSLEEHLTLGAAYEAQNMRSRAGKEYGAALRLDQKSIAALIALGNLAFQDMNLVEAEIYYRKALKLEPKHVGANNNLATVFLLRGTRLKLAEHLAKTALEASGPYRSYVLDTLANVYMRQGRIAEAKLALDEAERGVHPMNELLRAHIAQSRRQLETYGRLQ